MEFKDRKAWAAWLHKNHTTSPGLWMRFAKKGSPTTTVTYSEAIEVALCYGWIDGQKKADSEIRWLQKFCPRQRKSIWSKINREKALALIEAGKMKPAGQQAIERAKVDGNWRQAYDSPSNATIPDDLRAALNKNAKARAFFATLNSANRYAILFRVQTAKKPETRARKIEQLVDMLEKHGKIHP